MRFWFCYSNEQSKYWSSIFAGTQIHYKQFILLIFLRNSFSITITTNVKAKQSVNITISCENKKWKTQLSMYVADCSARAQ